MTGFRYYLADVFTNVRFGGNQLAIVPDAEHIPESFLQKIAKEFNLSETTFIFPPDKEENDCKVRIFTPAIELPTAGHPTLGTAFVILSKNLFKPANKDYFIFEEKVGEIKISFKYDNGLYHSLTMNQPLPEFGPVFENTEIIADILSVNINEIDTDSPVQSVSCGNNFLFIPVKKLDTIRNLKLRTDMLEKYSSKLDSTQLYVFTRETVNPGSGFHSRMFAPMIGIFEDPATGSAAGPFGCYLVEYGLSEGREIICEQGFEMGRPSILKVNIELTGNEISGVYVSGDAVNTGNGEMYID